MNIQKLKIQLKWKGQGTKYHKNWYHDSAVQDRDL